MQQLADLSVIELFQWQAQAVRIQSALLQAAAGDEQFIDAEQGQGLKIRAQVFLLKGCGMLVWQQLENPIIQEQQAVEHREHRNHEGDGHRARGPGALETKCCFDYKILMQEWDGGKTPPRMHEIQLQQQMYVGDGEKPFEWGVIALWCGGDMTYFQRKPMPDLWKTFEQTAKEFYDDILAGREPEPFGDPVELPLLKQMFHKPTGEIINAVEKFGEVEATKLAQRVVDADYQRVQRLAAEKVEEKVKAELLGLLKDADEIELPQGIRVTRKINTSNYKAQPARTSTSISVKTHIPQQIDGGFGGF